jgi:hypothetical protein
VLILVVFSKKISYSNFVSFWQISFHQLATKVFWNCFFECLDLKKIRIKELLVCCATHTRAEAGGPRAESGGPRAEAGRHGDEMLELLSAEPLLLRVVVSAIVEQQ